MPPEMAVSMRHTKIKREEAALLAGELSKPSWESKNEGIHERVSFEDSIWGFDLAGGSFYKTPLRVTYVKPDSRAEKAGIRPGDKLKRINDIDTSTLTIQEAHEIIISSGIHLKLAVTAPEDEEDAYFCYEDPYENGYDSEEERRREEEKAKKRQVHARVSHYWSLQWPWVSKRRVIYRESNCFMVPSKFEEKHRDKFPALPFHRLSDDLVLDSLSNLKLNAEDDGKTEYQKLQEKLNSEQNLPPNTIQTENLPESQINETKKSVNSHVGELVNAKVDGSTNYPSKLEEKPIISNDKIPEIVEPENNTPESISESHKESNENLKINDEPIPENLDIVTENDGEQEITDTENDNAVEDEAVINGEADTKDDEIIDELLNGDIEKSDEQIIDSILNENNSENNDDTDDR